MAESLLKCGGTLVSSALLENIDLVCGFFDYNPEHESIHSPRNAGVLRATP